MMLSKLELIQHLHNDVYCRLRPSGNHGVGVFAIKDIPAKTNPFRGAFIGDYETLNEKELEQLPAGVQEMIKAYCVCENEMWSVPNVGLNSIDISFFINHSKTPNVVTVNGESFFTSRSIKAGEEILSDYDSYSEGLK